MSIADRIRRVLEVREWSARKLSEESGLAGSQISTVLKRLDKDPEAIEVETVKAIAKGAKVAPDWLLTGRGDPEPGEDLPSENESFEDPRFANLSNWPAILQAAKIIAPELPAEVWDIVARCHPLATAPITPGMVADLARLVLKYQDFSAKKPR
jgi:transcriptional regulator with XRE-family HTH domain